MKTIGWRAAEPPETVSDSGTEVTRRWMRGHI